MINKNKLAEHVLNMWLNNVKEYSPVIKKMSEMLIIVLTTDSRNAEESKEQIKECISDDVSPEEMITALIYLALFFLTRIGNPPEEYELTEIESKKILH